MKPTSCNKILHKRHEQLGFYILILFLKRFKQLEPFIFCGTKAHSFEDEKDILVSVPYLTALDIRHITHYAFLNHIVLFFLILKTSPKIAQESISNFNGYTKSIF